MVADQCPECAQPVTATDHYCEKCGRDLTGSSSTVDASARTGHREAKWLSSTGPPERCGGCDATTFGAEGFCDTCGRRRPAARDQTDLDLGVIAAATDKGKRHHNNEDAVALGQTADVLLAVVCDGVSSSSRPDTASHAAADAAAASLVGALQRHEPAPDAINAAVRAAQAAAALAGGPHPGNNPPSSTFVCAVVTPDAITVGWVGDSRAYWLPAVTTEAEYGRPACLTVDDSLAGHLAAVGRPLPADVPYANAAALMRWLGADAPDTTPHLVTFTPPGPGRVIVCSDGLFRYRPDAADLAAATPHDKPLATAQALVRLALDAGGQDNVTVAVLPYPPKESP